MQSKYLPLRRPHSALVVVDIQERLLPAIFEKQRVVQNTIRLAQGAGILQVPVLATEQYRKGLGATVPEVAAAIAGFAPLEKVTFSAFRANRFPNLLSAGVIQDIILCGIEAHVCVSQTALDLLKAGLRVFVVSDAVSSRTSANYQSGLERMREAGAILASTEMVLFELLGEAGTDEFKQILPLIK